MIFFIGMQYDRYGDACLHGCVGWSDQTQCQNQGYNSISYPLQGTN